MAATESTMLALGTPAPAFRLTDFNGKVCTLEDFAAARGLVVAFICNHCPYVKHMRSESAIRNKAAMHGVPVRSVAEPVT